LRPGILILTILLSASCGSRAQSTNNPPVKQVAPGIFEIGKVRLDKQSRSVSFPAVVNMTEAIIEYLVVTKEGKFHESLLCTDAQPKHIHVAMLLLDAKGAGTNAVPENPLKPIPGDAVIIEVTWKDKGREKRIRAEDLVFNTITKTNLTRGPWIYNGSTIENGRFMADLDGSIVSLITDPFALVNNPRPGRDNDDLCEVNTNSVPALDTSVEVRLILEKK
jgi:hypothetical protein